MRKSRRILSILLAAFILAGFNLAAAAEAQVERSEGQTLELSAENFKTLNSLQKVTDNFYVLDYYADYALDDMLALGAADTDELAYQISQQVLEGLPFQCAVPNLGCSAFAAVTPEGDYIQGRNLDIADAQNTLIRTRPENGYASLSTASGLALGYFDYMPESMMGRLLLLAAPYFPVDGINEKGLSVAFLLQYAAPPLKQDTGKVAITTTMAVRMLLDKAATVEEAIELMAQYDMNGIANTNYHFQIADAEGNSVVIEYVQGEMRVLRPEEYGKVVTNYYLSRDVVEEYRDGEDRLISLQAALDENEGIVTAEQAMTMLDNVKAIHDYDPLSGIDYNTSYSIVFNNSQCSMDICMNMDYSTSYYFEVNGEF